MPGLNKDLYWVACVLAGPWRRGYLPRGVHLLSEAPRFPRVRRVVYIACDRGGAVVYVGKVTRADVRAVRSRTFEHVRDEKKAHLWAWLHVVPLRDDTPTEVAEHLEGVIGRRLLPTTSQRLPRPLRAVPEPEGTRTNRSSLLRSRPEPSASPRCPPSEPFPTSGTSPTLTRFGSASSGRIHGEIRDFRGVEMDGTIAIDAWRGTTARDAENRRRRLG